MDSSLFAVTRWTRREREVKLKNSIRLNFSDASCDLGDPNFSSRGFLPSREGGSARWGIARTLSKGHAGSRPGSQGTLWIAGCVECRRQSLLIMLGSLCNAVSHQCVHYCCPTSIGLLLSFQKIYCNILHSLIFNRLILSWMLIRNLFFYHASNITGNQR